MASARPLDMSIVIREAIAEDVPMMAQVRAAGAWTGGAGADVMARYLAGEHHPRHALAARTMFVAEQGETLLGFIAGHRTERYECSGELQWFFVSMAHRGTGVADRLFARMASWFAANEISRVCVNVEPGSTAARRFYARHGATELNEYWMVWHRMPEQPPSDAPLDPPAT